MARLLVGRQERDTGEGLPSGAVLGSMTLHTVAVLFLGWGATRVTLPEAPLVYRVDLVAAPSEVTARTVPRPERVRQPEPEPEPEPKAQETRPTVTEKPREESRPEEPAREETARAEPEEITETAAAAPSESEEGKVDQPVRLEGARFAYPEYLENIIIQIKRHWRPPSGGRQLRAELAFTIQRDGSVVDVSWIRRSGSIAFDLEARGAIETAGRRGAFGPLPEEYPADQLRVSFFFDPSRY